MTNTFTYTLLLGLSAASAVVLFRALPPGKQLAATGKKPWACDICMSFWAIVLEAMVFGATDLMPWNQLWLAIPAYIVCLWLVKQTAEVDFPFQKADTDKEDKHV